MYSSMLSVYFCTYKPDQIWSHKDYYIQVILSRLEKYELKKKNNDILHFIWKIWWASKIIVVAIQTKTYLNL